MHQAFEQLSRKWSTFEALVDPVHWWKLLGEELRQGVRAPLGELTCNQRSNRLKDDKLQACQQGNTIKDMAQAKNKKAQVVRVRCTCAARYPPKAGPRAYIGRWCSSVLRGHVTVSRALVDRQESNAESDTESAVEGRPLWTVSEQVGDTGPPCPPPQQADRSGEGGGGGGMTPATLTYATSSHPCGHRTVVADASPLPKRQHMRPQACHTQPLWTLKSVPQPR